MSHAIVASTQVDLTRRLRLATEDNMTVLRPEQVPITPGPLLTLFEHQPDVSTIVLDVTEGQVPLGHALELTRRIFDRGVGLSVLLVHNNPATIALEALRAGVRDVIALDTTMDDLRLALREADDASGVRTPGDTAASDLGTGRVITVASPKGGVGKTTLATNLAVALAGKSPQGTVIVDLDVQFGDVAAALDLDPGYTLGDIATSAVPNIIELKALLTQHPSGLQVVAGVRSPVEADQINPLLVSDLLEVLKREFRYVVVDSAPGVTEETLAALDRTNDLVLVSTLDVPGIRGLRKEIDLLDELHLSPHSRHFVLNMVEKAGGLTIGDAEATLGQSIDLVIPRHPRMARSTNQGVPLVALHPSDRVARDIVGLSERFAPFTRRRDRRLTNLRGRT